MILTDSSKNLRHHTVTNREGLFTFTQEPPSSYTVQGEHAGFGVAELPALVLNVNDRSSIRIELRLTPRSKPGPVRSPIV